MTSRRGYTGVMLAALVAIFLASDAEGESADVPPLQLEAKIPLGDVHGRIDHMAVDLARHRLFVAALGNDTLAVVDLEAKRLDRLIGELPEPQGVGYDPATDTLYVANAGDGSVRLFKGAELSPVGRIELGSDADNIRVDSKVGRIFVGHGDGALAIVDAATHDKIGSVPLKAHPESFQLDGNTNRVFVNVPKRCDRVVDRTSEEKDCVLADGGPQRELRHGAGSRPPTCPRGFSQPGGARRLLCGGRGVDIVHPDLRRRR
jgi:hypothetical protein